MSNPQTSSTARLRQKRHRLGPFLTLLNPQEWATLILIGFLLVILSGCGTMGFASGPAATPIITPELKEDPAEPVLLTPPAGESKATAKEVLENLETNADLWAACRANLRGWQRLARENGWIK